MYNLVAAQPATKSENSNGTQTMCLDRFHSLTESCRKNTILEILWVSCVSCVLDSSGAVTAVCDCFHTQHNFKRATTWTTENLHRRYVFIIASSELQ